MIKTESGCSSLNGFKFIDIGDGKKGPRRVRHTQQLIEPYSYSKYSYCLLDSVLNSGTEWHWFEWFSW